MDRRTILLRLSKNPHYKLSPKQAAELEVYTQEVRADDIEVTAPIVRRKKRVTRNNEIRRDQMPEENLRSKAQEVPYLPESDSQS